MNHAYDLVENATQFSNFAQKLKMIVWNTEERIFDDRVLDEIALELWEYIKKIK